jgi:F-type H+-transporting ATPase subunit gamma
VPTFEALRRRISATESLQSIVRTMKSLSAVSVRQYDQAAAALASYARTIELGLRVVLRDRSPGPERPRREARRTGAVVFGSDHGLCGGFNDGIAAFARTSVEALGLPREARAWLAVGGRAAARLEGLGERIEIRLALPGAAVGLAALVDETLLAVETWQAQGVTRVLLFHNRRTRDAAASPHMARLLPVDLRHFQRLAGRPWPSRTRPTFTMDADRLLAALVRQHLFVSVFRAGAESLASEHTTRLAAMQAAERSIEERLEALTAESRRVRQDTITAELLDLVSGFEASREPDIGTRPSPIGASAPSPGSLAGPWGRASPRTRPYPPRPDS